MKIKIEKLAAHLDILLVEFEGYGRSVKGEFLKTARAFLKRYAREVLKLDPSTYDLRVNHGGIAVSGEVTLHSENLYISIEAGCFEGRFMWRTCTGRKDYTGGINQWTTASALVQKPLTLFA